MTASRRRVLLQGFAIGAGVIAANMPGIVALAQAGPHLRRSLHGMALNDPILEAWRDGVRQLKALPSGNPVSWANFATIHGTSAGFNKCPHGNWYFLPWHRAYLLMYERVVRELTGQSDFALPYWDWTEDRQLPAAFVDPTFGGTTNPLFEARGASPTDALGDGVVGPGVINTILTETPFERFGTSRPVGQSDLNQSWITCTNCGTYGTLEGNPHNLVHGFVGGIMGGVQSAGDPIFMMHHCNIDRIWWTWRQGGQVDSPDPLWTNMTFENNFFNPNGSFYSPKVSDLLVPEPLGYTYDTAPTPTTTPPVVVSGYETLTSLYTVADLTAAKLAGISAYVAQNKETATPAKYLEMAVAVEAEALNAVAHRKSAPSGSETLNLNQARQQAVGGPRAYAFIRDIAYTEQENTEYRVFINCDYLSAETPIADRSYVGTFGFFGGHGSHGGSEAKLPSIALDITSAIQSVYGSATAPPGSLRVQIQPVIQRAGGKAAGTITPARVEVAIVSA